MKFNFLFLFLIVNLFSMMSFAQEKNVKIEISLEDSHILTTSKNVPVKIKITNKSKQELNTEELGNIFLYFSKCHKDEMCGSGGDLLFAIVEIESKTLKTNKSIKFESNLSDLIWVDSMSSFRHYRKNFYGVSAENIYFYAAIPTRKAVLPEGTRLPEDFLSNEITVNLSPK